MQQLSLLETSLPVNRTVAVWATLDDEQQALVVAVLARLIARLTAAQSNVTVTADKDKNHE